MPGAGERATSDTGCAGCCPHYHEAVELIGKRWTGAIVGVLLNAQEGSAGGSLRFSQVAQAVPELSDRLLSQRMKELEARGIVRRTVLAGQPVHVEYALTEMGRELGPALSQLQAWAQRWLADDQPAADAPDLPPAIAAATR